MLTLDRKKEASPIRSFRHPLRVPVRRDSAQLTRGVGACALTLALAVNSGVFAGPVGSSALVIPRPQAVQPYRCFGDRTVAVPLLIHAPEPEKLTLRAELVQLTASFSVPIGGELEVPLPRYPSPPSGIEVDLSVVLPAVRQETDFELRIRSRWDGDGDWQAAGRIALRVYPDDLLNPVRSWAKSHPLRVDDDHWSLIQFLRQQSIPVVGDGRQAFTGSRGVTVYAGARALRKHALFPQRGDETAVFFTERQTDTPRLVIERIGRATAVTVEMRILDRLATDPLAQKIFLEVFQLLHEEKPPTKGDIR